MAIVGLVLAALGALIFVFVPEDGTVVGGRDRGSCGVSKGIG